jgi:hypothetical protein
MARWQTISLGLFVLAGVLALMGLTNPDGAAYEGYIAEQIADRASAECDKAPGGFAEVLRDPCAAGIRSAMPHVKHVISTATIRQDFLLFSVYSSEISIPQIQFTAKVESIGAFDRFYTYKLP